MVTITDLAIEAVGDKIVVAPTDPEEVSAGGIVIPDSAQKKSQEAEVICVGEDVEGLEPADIVYIAKYAGTELQVGGRDLLVLRKEDILVKVSGTVATKPSPPMS